MKYFICHLGILFYLFYSLPAHALSCAMPPGDPFQVIVDGNRDYWLGKIKIMDVQNAPNDGSEHFSMYDRVLTIEPLENYQSTQNIPVGQKIYLPSRYINWGPFEGNRASDGGTIREVYLFYYQERQRWQYGGPGACTFYSDKHWADLKAGKYKR